MVEPTYPEKPIIPWRDIILYTSLFGGPVILLLKKDQEINNILTLFD